MANAISYSLFGFSESYKDCFNFSFYLRYFELNLKMKELIYPDWDVNVVLDDETYNSLYKYFFDYHAQNGKIRFQVVDRMRLCKMMLQRMRPIFSGEYDRVICRDTDSLLTYRERQAVEYWIGNGRIVHAITDSVSHTAQLMGGMIGFMCKEFVDTMNLETFDAFLSLGSRYDFSIKGTDQIFLELDVLPKVAHSMTEHYILGRPQSFRGDCFNYIQDIELPISPELRGSNIIINHIGQSGFIIEPVLDFLDKHLTEKQKEYFKKIEKQYRDTFYWAYEY